MYLKRCYANFFSSWFLMELDVCRGNLIHFCLFLCFNILCFGSVETLTHFSLKTIWVICQPWWPYNGLDFIIIFHAWLTLSSIILLFFLCYTHTHTQDFKMGLSEVVALVALIGLQFSPFFTCTHTCGILRFFLPIKSEVPNNDFLLFSKSFEYQNEISLCKIMLKQGHP